MKTYPYFKTVILIFAVLTARLSYAGTGAARDEFILVGLILLLLAAILGAIYLVRFISRKINQKNRMTEIELPEESTEQGTDLSKII